MRIKTSWVRVKKTKNHIAGESILVEVGAQNSGNTIETNYIKVTKELCKKNALPNLNEAFLCRSAIKDS